MVLMTAERIGEAVIADINQNIQIHAANRFGDHSLCLARAETGNLCGEQVGITLIAGKCQTVLVLVLSFRPPLYQIVVDLLAQRFAALYRDDSQRTCGDCFQVSLFFLLCSHSNPHFLFLAFFWDNRISDPVSL